MSKLAKQLKRDLKANPKKAGMLALLCLVCVWFWGPLIFPKDESTKKKPTTTTAAASAPTTAVPVAASPRATSGLPWQVLAEKLLADARMKAAMPANDPTAEVGRRNPFAAPEPTEAEWADFLDEVVNSEPEETKPSESMTAATKTAWSETPLTLSSTFVGGRTKRAVINGRAYAEGAAIGTVQDIEIRLERVAPRLAVVVWNGDRRELRIPKPGEEPSKQASLATRHENSAEDELLESASTTDDQDKGSTEAADRPPANANDTLTGDSSL